tara:strand:- start:339 stop:701 length:363 start_codon:yes stop_codon:yes gene_type:complete
VSILSQILGSGDVIQKGMALIDSMHVSETEEIAAKVQAKQQMLNAYAPFKLAQRYLALIFSFTFVASYLLVLSLYFVGHDITPVQTIISTFKIDWIMLTIVGFYFSSGFAEGILEKRNNK